LEGAVQIEYDSGDKDAVPPLQQILQLRPNETTSHAMLATVRHNNSWRKLET
jgi:hypothetical protein